MRKTDWLDVATSLANAILSGKVAIQIETYDCLEPLSPEESKKFSVSNRQRRGWIFRCITMEPKEG